MRSPRYDVLAVALAAAPASAAVPAVDIPAGRLSTALTTLGRQAGIDILFAETLIGDRLSLAVQGKVDPEAALAKLLNGTGLAFHRTAEGAFVINKAAAGPEAPPGDDTIPEILIVGRRAQNSDIRRTENDIQPYQVYTRRDIQRSHADSFDEFARTQLPANAQIAAPAQLAANGGNTRSEIDLRGLGPNQTLVLVDGRRLPNLPKSTFAFDQPDLNGIPLEMIDRVEVLTATAGGIYGTGATSGAVNIILRRDDRGALLTATTGLTTRGDAFQYRLFARLGVTPDHGRTNLTLSVSTAHSATLPTNDRGYVEDARRRRAANDLATLIAEQPTGSAINIFSATPLSLKPQYGGTALGSTYTNLPLTAGADATMRGALLVANAGTLNLDLPQDFGTRRDGIVATPRTRSIFVNARHDFGSGVEAFLDLIDTRNRGTVTRFGGQFIVSTLYPNQASDPFEQPVSLSLPLGRYNSTTDNVLNKMLHYTAGLILPLPGGWRANAEYGGGRARSRDDALTSALGNGYVQAFGGQPLSGKPPLDPLGDWAAYLAALSSYQVLSGFQTDQTNKFRDIDLRVAGSLLSMPGGQATLTLLAEERRETVGASHALISFNGMPAGTLSLPRFTQRVRSVYGEARLPLTSGRGLLSHLELQLAVRRDWTSITLPAAATFFGDDPPPSTRTRSTTLYTTGARFSPVRGVLLRASSATGALPPSSNQVGARLFTGINRVPDPLRGGQRLGTDAVITSVTGGNPDLRSERAQSLSAGIVLTPGGEEGPRLSLDFTRIAKRDEIVSFPLTASELVAEPLRYPGRVTRAALTDADHAQGFSAGAVTRLDLTNINLGRTRIDAIDAAYDQKFSIGPLGSFTIYARATWEPHYRQRVSDTVPTVDRVGYSDGPLEWRGNGGLEWSRGRFMLGTAAQFYGRYRAARVAMSPDAAAQLVKAQGSNHIPAQLYFDLSGGYRFAQAGASDRRVPELRWGILNIFDHRPPVVADASGPGYSYYGDPSRRRVQVTVEIPFGD